MIIGSWEHLGHLYGTDKASGGHKYLVAYQQFVWQPVRSMLEIGVAAGNSLRMWAKIFPQAERIVGIDINPECCREYDDPRIEVHVMNATDALALATIDGNFDLIIDDGSHQTRDAVETFELLYPRVRPEGVYSVEDLPVCEAGHDAETPFSTIVDTMLHAFGGWSQLYCGHSPVPLDEERGCYYGLAMVRHL